MSEAETIVLYDPRGADNNYAQRFFVNIRLKNTLTNTNISMCLKAPCYLGRFILDKSRSHKRVAICGSR